jgi:hypothetical protein
LTNLPGNNEGDVERLHGADASIEVFIWQTVLLQEMTNQPGSEEGHEECLHGADAGIEGKADKQYYCRR